MWKVSMEAPMSHVPVMAGEVLQLIGASTGRVLVDLTVGAGGHSAAYLEATTPEGRVHACDRDPEALALAEVNLARYSGRVTFLHGDSVSCIHQLARQGVRPDALLMDLGVSSMQLDEPERGFTFREDALLDMRMDPTSGPTASDLVNSISLQDLELALRDLGGEPRARRIAQAIVERRGRRPFRTTGDLRELVEQTLRRRGGRIHPATHTFQAIRMLVNKERELLTASLPLATQLVKPGGFVACLSFHSGEDRIVKVAFKEMAASGRGELVTRKPLSASMTEQRNNRRSRSARLRVLKVL
jgi:16S rRNA (cytosine1402-N4)-methyltransferase